jgi:hypothetical protein
VTYVYWHEKPKRATQTATVSGSPDNPESLADEVAGASQENEYTADEHMTNIRLAGARRRRV